MSRFKKRRNKDNQKIILKLGEDIKNLNSRYLRIKEFIKKFEMFNNKIKRLDLERDNFFKKSKEKERLVKKRIREIKESKEKKIRKRYSNLIKNSMNVKRIKRLRKARDKGISEHNKRINREIEKIEEKYGLIWEKQRRLFDKEIINLKKNFLGKIKHYKQFKMEGKVFI